MTTTYLERIQRLSDGRVKLHFNSGRSLLFPAEVCSALDLEDGQVITPDALRRDPDGEGLEVLVRAARRHLGRYTKTRQEFRRHFRGKGYPEPWLDEVEPRLRREGYLDDEAAARARLGQLEDRGYGPRRLVSELVDRGIDHERARTLVRETCSPDEARRRAREYARNHASLSPRKMARRLQSRGFSSSVVRECVEEYAKRSDEDPGGVN